ncbi:hypothetical protein [Haloplanus natans]|uniref:hypothetical protein n=1 Tax=Haloplanus natans TaxID=376171 RepID=UPI00146F9C09|nr:hypothetical protein [Haloplanus natans]
MATGTQSGTDDDGEPSPPETPAVSVCETCPGRTVFLEAGNTDGWIASDLTVEPTQ